MSFREAVSDFLVAYTGVYATSTLEVRRRELMRLAAIVEDLDSEGLLSTQDPALMSIDDIKAIAVALREHGTSSNTRTHALGRLRLLCRFFGNPAVDNARARYPMLFPPKRETKLNVLASDEVRKVLELAEMEHAWRELRAYASVVIALCTGARPQEVRMLRDSDFDLEAGTLHIVHVKGEGEYGEPRTVPIMPKGVPVIARYIDELHARGLNGWLFQNSKGVPVSGQTQRVWRRIVVDSTGVELDHRILRRTYGQMLEDLGVSEEHVSVLLGHASTATTARYYARVREGAAIAAAREAWEKKERSRTEETEMDWRMDALGKIPRASAGTESEREGIRTPGLQLRRLPPYPD